MNNRTGLKVFFLLLGIYILTFHGQTVSRDENMMLATSRSLLSLSLSFNAPLYGQTSSEYGIGLPVMAVPFMALDVAVRSIVPGAGNIPFSLTLLANALFCAILGALFFFYLHRVLKFDEDVAIFTTLLLGLTTQLFPYSGTFFSEPLTTLALFASFVGLDGAGRSKNIKPLIAAGCAFALALLARSAALVYLPLCLAWIFWNGNTQQKSICDRFLRCCFFLAPVAVVSFLIIFVNYALRGSVFAFGYGGQDFTTGYFAGLYGLLISPGRGLIPYNPLVLVSLVGIPAFVKRWPRRGAFAILFVIITAVFYGRFWTWHGGWTPGTRFLLPTLPFIFLFLPIVLEKWKSISFLGQFSFWILVFAGAAIQIVHVMVNPLDYNNELFGLLGQQENPFLYSPQFSSLGGLWQLVSDGSFRWKAWIEIGNSGLYGFIINAIGAFIFFNAGVHIISKVCECWLVPVLCDFWTFIKSPTVLWILILMIALAIVSFCGKGPRGIEIVDSNLQGFSQTDIDGDANFARWKFPPASKMNGWPPDEIGFMGYLEAPVTGTFKFNGKIRGSYSLSIAEQIIFANSNQEMPQHLQRGDIPLERGQVYPITGSFAPHPSEGGIFYIYWTLPGEGVAISPISSEYLYPRRLNGIERFFTTIWRKLWLILLAVFLPVIILSQRRLQAPSEPKTPNHPQPGEEH